MVSHVRGRGRGQGREVWCGVVEAGANVQHDGARGDSVSVGCFKAGMAQRSRQAGCPSSNQLSHWHLLLHSCRQPQQGIVAEGQASTQVQQMCQQAWRAGCWVLGAAGDDHVQLVHGLNPLMRLEQRRVAIIKVQASECPRRCPCLLDGLSESCNVTLLAHPNACAVHARVDINEHIQVGLCDWLYTRHVLDYHGEAHFREGSCNLIVCVCVSRASALAEA